MASLKYIVLMLALIAGRYCQENKVNPEPRTTPTIAPNVATSSTVISTTSPSTTTSTTPASTTQPTTPPVTTHSTTTARSTTSTTTATTTSPPHNSTTAAPTTTASPSTTVKPTPIPDPGNPDVGNWTVMYTNSNRACVVINIAVQFEVRMENQTTKINLPKNASFKGSCDEDDEWLNLSWGEKDGIKFDFSKTNTSKFELKNITASLSIKSDKGSAVYNLVHEKSEFPTSLSKSYKCARVQTLNLTKPGSNETVAFLHISHTQFQAFGNASGHTFDEAMDCESSSTPDIVPIVVGCVLAALVIMVLIAYLVGRRRCQARGYLSM